MWGGCRRVLEHGTLVTGSHITSCLHAITWVRMIRVRPAPMPYKINIPWLIVIHGHAHVHISYKFHSYSNIYRTNCVIKILYRPLLDILTFGNKLTYRFEISVFSAYGFCKYIKICDLYEKTDERRWSERYDRSLYVIRLLIL